MKSFEEFVRDCRRHEDGDVVQRIIRKGRNHYLGDPWCQNASSHIIHTAWTRHLTQGRQGQRLLDLGCGVGAQLEYAAHDGLLAYGIEFDREHYDGALENVQGAAAKGFFDPGMVRIAHGNFFPAGFRVAALEKENGKHPHHDRFREYLDEKAAAAPQWGACPFDPAQSYEEFLGTVDIFYHFQVERTENLLRLMAMYAKPGAELILANSLSDRPATPAGFTVEHYEPGVTRYRKD